MRAIGLSRAVIVSVRSLALGSTAAWAADDRKSRGELDANFCDEDCNPVVEVPKDNAKWKDPLTLVFAYTPIEGSAVYANLFKSFTDYLGACTQKKTFTTPCKATLRRSKRCAQAGFTLLVLPPVKPDSQ